MNDEHEDDRGAEMNERELRSLDSDGFDTVGAAIHAWEAGLMHEDRRPPASTREVGNELIDEPDDNALVGALLAQAGYAIEDLAQPSNVTILVDSPREQLAQDIHRIDHLLLLLGAIRDEAAQCLANLMEAKLESIGGHAVERTRSDKVEWDKDGAWMQVRGALIDRWALGGGDDVYAPERIQLIDRTLADIATVYTTRTPTVSGLKALQINPYELRATTPATRWQVKVS